MNRYISKSYPKTKAAINRQHTERGQLKCQLLLVRATIVYVEQHSRKLSKSCIELECMPFLSIKDSKPPRTHALGSDSLYYNKNTETQDHKTVRGSGGIAWDGKICICTMLTILLLKSACLCYKLRVYPRSCAIRTKFTKPIAI